MSKSKRYRAIGRHWEHDFTRHLVFPGKSVEQIGRTIIYNNRMVRRNQLKEIQPLRVQQQVRTWLNRLRKSCIGGEFKRLMNKKLTPGELERLRERTGNKPPVQ